MFALNKTIYEKKEIYSIVTDSTIADIKQRYQCKENNGSDTAGIDKVAYKNEYGFIYSIILLNQLKSANNYNESRVVIELYYEL